MDPRLLEYYNRELQFIREMGAEFARTYPRIAARLGVDGIECADPYIERLLEGLDERDRMMLILKEVEGFAIEEIAEILDLNANTVKVRLFRARRRIVNQVRKRKDGSRGG